MRLRNKRSGEIVELLAKPSFTIRNEDFLQSEVNTFNSLAELNADWEDYEEPKQQYYIKENGVIGTCGAIEDDIPDEMLSEMNQIGNYFESKEEAELVLRKLKAWKRLKDEGLKVVDYNGNIGELDQRTQEILYSDVCRGSVLVGLGNIHRKDLTQSIKKDIELLFLEVKHES